MLRFSLLSLFPELLQAYFDASIPGRALAQGLFEYRTWQIRDFAVNDYGKVDDALYGGGTGMLMMAEPIAQALEAARADYIQAHSDCSQVTERLIYVSPRGRRFNQELAADLVQSQHVLLLCGHYEGVDQRLLEAYPFEEISLGDFVLSGGELAAAAMIDACCRLIPGVLPNAEAYEKESFQNGLLEGAQYTRPPLWRGRGVPEVLLSGHAQRIEAFRHRSALWTTLQQRPDLLDREQLSVADWEELLELFTASQARESS